MYINKILMFCHESVNQYITYAELSTIISWLTNNKAIGIEWIPNEILKYNDIKQILLKFLKYGFELGMTPSSWLQTISPIWKSARKDHCVPITEISAYYPVFIMSTPV